MLFRKDHEPACALCRRSSEIDDVHVLCPKYGVVAGTHRCRRFSYDPLKRRPMRRAKLPTNLNFDIR